MNRFFKRLALQAKLLLIALLPILFIIFLTFQVYVEKTKNVAQIQSYLSRINQAGTLSRLIDQLQKERRYSFDYALQKTHQVEMLAARPKTDSLLRLLEKSDDKNLINFKAYTFLENFDTVRKRIDMGVYKSNQVMHFYSSAVFRFSTLYSTPYSNNQYLNSVYEELVAEKLLSEQITYLGIINANVYNVLYTKAYMAETLLGTLPSYDIYKSYNKEFLAKVSPRIQQLYITIRENSALKPVNDYLQKRFATYTFDSSYNYYEWSELSDNAIAELSNLQSSLLASVENKVRSYYKREQADKTRTIIIVIAIIIFLLLVAVYILLIINKSLKELSSAAIRISKGETNLKLKPISKDAIGSLASSILRIDAKNKELALTAERIGKGEFDVPIQARSQGDQLGNAIINMRNSLQNFTGELHHSREEFKQLADFVPQIIWTAGPDGFVDYYNKRWYEVTGGKEGNGDQSWIPILHPEDVGTCLSSWYSSVETGEPYEIEYRFKDITSNSYRWFLGRAVPIKNERGEIIKWFGTATDIHDQKVKNQNLEELVGERTVELQRSNEDLQQFAHVASHDLKEPLRKIRTFGDRLSLEYGSLLPEKGKIYIDKMQSASARMTDLIESVLSYSVVNATAQTHEIVDLNIVFENIKSDLELLILQKDAKILCSQLPKIKASPALMHQLFYNLINNALKFTKSGVPPIIEIAQREVASAELTEVLDVYKGGKYICIMVKDNGIGFNPEYANKMFEVFSRLNTRETYEGTGLGLALCKKIVQRHHGAIYAKGEEGVGAVFSIILPL